MATGSFDETYWTERSQYRKFGEHAAATEALRDWYAGMWRLLKPYLPTPGRHVDAGCGHGSVVHDLLGRGWDAHGFDISNWMIEQVQHDDPSLAERFAVGDLQGIPFDGDFALITCFEVLEHVADPVADLRALGSRLAPGGRIIATTPNLHPKLPWPDPLTSDPTHINVHEPSWWSGALNAAGLRAVTVSTFIALPALWRVHPAFSRWVGLGPRMGPGTLLVAERA